MNPAPHPQLPSLPTARLTLVPVSLAEAAEVLDGAAPFSCATGWPHPGTLAAFNAALARGEEPTYTWRARLGGPGDDGPTLGDLGLKGAPGPDGVAEIGYGLAAPWRGQGLGTEAVTALLGWAEREPTLAVLRAEVDADNLASRRLLEALDFHLEEVSAGQLWFARNVAGETARA